MFQILYICVIYERTHCTRRTNSAPPFLSYFRILIILPLARTGNTVQNNIARTGITVQTTVLRHNFGVLFKTDGNSIPQIDTFIKFKMTLETKIRGANYICEGNSSLIFRDQLKILNKEISVLTTLIGQKYLKTRSKRALLLIGGKILKALFGVVTEDEVHKLKTILQILDHTIHDDKHYRIERDLLISKLAHSHHSLIKLVKTHITEAEGILGNYEDNLEILGNFDSKLITKLNINTQSRDCLWKILQTQMHYKSLIDIIYALGKLKSGFLTREILPVDKLLIAMDMWDMILFRNYTLKLSQRSTDYFYNNKLVHKFDAEEDRINYTVRIPAYRNDSEMDIYRIIRFEVPSLTHNHSVLGYTLIENRAEFLIINSTHYSTQDTINYARLPSAYRMINSTSCFLAIFLDSNQNTIKQHCIFNYYAGVAPDFKHIKISGNIHMILTSDSFGHINCEHENVSEIILTPMSIIALPCHCMLTTRTFVLRPEGDNCDIVSNYTINTGINIPLFLSLNINMTDMSGGDMLNLSMPGMQLLHANFSRQIAALDIQERFVRDIIGRTDRLIKLGREYSKPYPIEMGLGLDDYGPIISSFVLSALSLCVSFYLLYRLHGLFAILLGFRSALGANLTLTNWEVPDFLASLNLTLLNTDPILADSMPDPWNNTMYSGDSSLNSNLAIGFYVLLTVALIALIGKVTRCIYKARTTRYHIMGAAGTRVYLKIKYLNDIYAFEVCSILHPISAITCPNTPLITAIRPPRFSSRSIEVDWTQFSLCEYFAGGKMVVTRFPRKFKIPRDCAAEVRAAIRSGAFEAAIMMADAHGNTMSMRTDAMEHRRGTTEL